MYNALFGTDMPLALRVVIAFVVVLALIGAIAYLVHRFGAGALNAAAAVRGRQPRLAVIDAASVDGRRRLLLIRRDNVEHLIMIGGPTDVVIEPNIVRATAAAPAREVPPARAADMLPRAMPLPESGMWPLQTEPMQRAPRTAPPPAPTPLPEEANAAWSVHPEAAPRTVPESEPRVAAERETRITAERESRTARELRIAAQREQRVARSTPERDLRVAAEREPRAPDSELNVTPEREPRVAPEGAPASASRTTIDSAGRGQNSERLAGRAADLSRTHIDPAIGSAPSPLPVRSAEPPRPPPAPAQPANETDEQNLAEMAQQLESALQRQRPAATPTIVPPAPRADPPPAPPRAEARSEAKPEAKAESKPETKPETKPAAKAAAKPSFDNLEQEMASLLGRPPGKS